MSGLGTSGLGQDLLDTMALALTADIEDNATGQNIYDYIYGNLADSDPTGQNIETYFETLIQSYPLYNTCITYDYNISSCGSYFASNGTNAIAGEYCTGNLTLCYTVVY